MLEEDLLQVAVPESAGTEAVFEVGGDRWWRDQFKELNGEVLFRVGLWFGWRAAVHDQAHDLLARGFFLAEDFDGVVITLAHFLAVRAGDAGGFVADARIGGHVGLAISLLKLDGALPGDFDILLFVAAYVHAIRVVNQD